MVGKMYVEACRASNLLLWTWGNCNSFVRTWAHMLQAQYKRVLEYFSRYGIR